MSNPTEALARALCSADGLDPDARERGAGPLWEHYQAQAARILADPAPLLAALTEAGVLTEEAAPATDMVPINGRNGRMIIVPGRHRYVTDWTEVAQR